MNSQGVVKVAIGIMVVIELAGCQSAEERAVEELKDVGAHVQGGPGYVGGYKVLYYLSEQGEEYVLLTIQVFAGCANSSTAILVS